MTLRELQQENKEWVAKNFGTTTTYRGLLGVVEEIGELAHAHLKGEQGIRYNAYEIHAMKADAVADTIIFLADYCNNNNIDMQKALDDTWAIVKQRDWTKNKETGQCV